MSDTQRGGQEGGINVSGGSFVVHGNAAGRDMNVGTMINREIDDALAPVRNVIAAAPEAQRGAAEEKLDALKAEAGKGNTHADDGVMAGLIHGLVDLIPAAASAVVSAFATPVLGAIAGPVTKIIIKSLGG